MKYLIVFSATMGLYYLRFFSLYEILYLFHLGIISILYVVPLKFNKIDLNFSLRKVPLTKIFLLAYVWASVTAYFPCMILGETDFSSFSLFLERFFFILALAIPFDIRDYRSDKENKLLTIPTIFGVQWSKTLSGIFFGFFICLSTFRHGLDFITLSRIVSSVLAFILILKINEKVRESYYLFCIDGIMIIHFIFLVFFQIIII
ncbi:MAG: hypothetical protein K2X86_18560 [Cytophagaceae bacterium]|nr:hypothetical protein [Cytophagaceae bacterium]